MLSEPGEPRARFDLAALRRRNGIIFPVVGCLMIVDAVVLIAAKRTYTAEALVQTDSRSNKLLASEAPLTPLKVGNDVLKSAVDVIRPPSFALKRTNSVNFGGFRHDDSQ